MVNVAEKAGHDPVRYGSERRESEPLMPCRKRIDDAETEEKSLTRDEAGGRPDCCPDGIRHEGGVTLHLALAWNVGTCRLDAKGEIQVGGPHEDESTEAGRRDGAIRSRVEGSGCGTPRWVPKEWRGPAQLWTWFVGMVVLTFPWHWVGLVRGTTE